LDEDVKKQIKKAVETTEKSLTRSLLRWKYKKEGKPIPREGELDLESTLVTRRARRVIRRRGKTIWKEVRDAYKANREKEGESRD
jgi:hypothetical protein